MSEVNDHDLLIEIRTLVRVQQESFLQHLRDESERIGVISARSEAAHRRMDYLMVGGVMVALLSLATLISRFV